MPRSAEYWKKRVVRHGALAGLSLAGVALVASLLDPRGPPIWKLSMGTAYVSFAWLVLTLSIGPVNLLRNRPNPVSTDLRRDIGIWAGLVAVIHVVIGLQVHLGNPWWYFVWRPTEPHRIPFRYDAGGVANYTGLAAVVVLVVLLALSNDLSLRRLGSRRWKGLQRWNYVGFGLTVLHGIIYQLALERRPAPWVAVFGVMILVAVAFQAAGVRRQAATQEARSTRRAGPQP